MIKNIIWNLFYVTKHYKRIRKFMKLAGQQTPDRPVSLDEKTALLRARLILEESIETINELGYDVSAQDHSLPLNKSNVVFNKVRDFNLIGVVDGCCDVSVVTVGTLIACGIPDEKIFKLVDENNLKKFGPGYYIREDGKIVKPPNHRPPDLKAEIEKL